MATEFQLACQQLRPLLVEARYKSGYHAAGLLNLAGRHETILLMPRAGGKTTLGTWSDLGEHGPLSTTGGWLDERPDQLPRELVRNILGMLKVRRTMRAQFPDYSPKVTLRPETWDRIKGKFYWLEPHNIAQLEFPQSAFYKSLAEAGASVDALAHFNPTWLKNFCDASGRLYPGLAFDALAETCARAETTDAIATAKAYGTNTACARFVAAQKDVDYWLTFMAADPRDSIPLERVLLRIRQARTKNRTRQLPFGLTGPKFVRYCEYAGIWKVNHMRHVVLAPPYATGAYFLKASLTDDAYARMLRE